MTFDEVASIFVLIMAAVLLGWRYRPRAFFGRLWATIIQVAYQFSYVAQPEESTPQKPDTKAVHVPVPGTDTSASTSPKEGDITGDDDYMPRVGRRLSDDAIVVMLATQKGEDGAKYRFSANQIYELVKGPRAEVLAQIRDIRDGPPAPQVREHQARLEQMHTR